MDALSNSSEVTQVRTPELSSRAREGFRVFGKVVLAVTAAVAPVMATIAAFALIPQTAIAVAAISALPFAGQIAIVAASILAVALAIFGIERLGRESALDPVPDSEAECIERSNPEVVDEDQPRDNQDPIPANPVPDSQ